MAANTQQNARATWTSPYPFELLNGGLGLSLSCTGTSARAALVGEGNAIVITNTSAYWVWVAFGTSSVVATASYFPIPPGTQLTVMLAQGDTSTHVAGITGGATATINVHRGHGV